MMPGREMAAGQGVASPPNRPALVVSDKVQQIPQALSIYINQLVYDMRRRGEDVTALSLGEAFFEIPLFDFTKLDVNRGYHYSDSQGIPELRNKIASYYRDHYGAMVDGASEVLITAGSKPAIFMAMQAILNPGDEVVIHEPAWLSYQEQARLIGAEVSFIRYDVDPANFYRSFSERTRLLIINNPNNPAGRVYTADELLNIYEQCRSRGIYFLVDEAYSDFLIDEKFVSLATIAPDKDGAITVNSLSKNMGMSGWRVGYIITAPPLLQQVLKLNQHLITCAPTILLYYLYSYFDDIIAVTLPQVRQVVERRSRVMRRIDELGLERMGGSATFYFFVAIGDYPGTSLDFALTLLIDHKIAVVPGSAYGTSTSRFVRISIGTESEERIEEALLVIRDMISKRTHDPVRLRESLAARNWPVFG